MLIPGLSPAASAWTLASSVAAAVSYADRGTSAIAASGILSDLRWTESQLGDVQSSFFVGYGATQVLGGLLSERGRGGDGDDLDAIDEEDQAFRAILPLSLGLSGLATMAFPAAARLGPGVASFDRFLLGIFEGMLLPSAMAGISYTVRREQDQQQKSVNIDSGDGDDGSPRLSTASALLIAGCYLGSAFAYSSAALLFGSSDPDVAAWPNVFYVNGVLAALCMVWFREEFRPPPSLLPDSLAKGEEGQTDAVLNSAKDLLRDTVAVGRATLESVSGRAILAAQFGQGALLYSIASWGPLYLERVGAVAGEAVGDISGGGGYAAASAAAATALILPQLTQAGVGVGVGAAADGLSAKFGTVRTRRTLQALSGILPAAILWYLSSAPGGDAVVSGAATATAALTNPEFLFGAAQTLSALSLGAVSVSHLEVAPRNAGTVYALGNVAAAAAGSVTVRAFGALLEADGGSDFTRPFRLVACLSAAGAAAYALTVQSEPEIEVHR